MDEQISLINIDVKDNFGLPVKSGTVTAVKGSKTYSENISDDK